MIDGQLYLLDGIRYSKLLVGSFKEKWSGSRSPARAFITHVSDIVIITLTRASRRALILRGQGRVRKREKIHTRQVAKSGDAV